MANYTQGRLTAEPEEASLDGATLHLTTVQSAAAVYPPVVPGDLRSSATEPLRDRARGTTKEPTQIRDNNVPLRATASDHNAAQPSVGQVVEQPFTAAEGDFFDIQSFHKRPIPGAKNAYDSSYLPTPALKEYKLNPPPIQKIRKFVKYPEYKTLNQRCDNFLENGWPLESPSAYDLAKAGMVYIGPVYDTDGTTVISDQCFCYKCGRTFCGWREGDDPEEQHLTIYPECSQTTWVVV